MPARKVCEVGYLQTSLEPFHVAERTLLSFQARAQRRLAITDRLGAGRFDPFVKFPIELNHRARELVDASKIGRHPHS